MPIRDQLIHIIQGCKLAKRESQKELYQNFYGFSMAICMRYSSENEDVIEIVNDGFLKVFRGIQSFEPKYENTEASLKGWIKRIMIHAAIDHFRKNKKNIDTYEIIDHQKLHPEVSESAIDALSYKEILLLVQRLSPAYRTIFNLYAIDGFKHEDIAQQLNISVGTSKSNLSKARLNLQKMLSEREINKYEQRAV